MASRRVRALRENLTAYAFILPAGILIFLFGLFPVGFALLVSVYRWRRFPDAYVGLDNYVRALGDFAYVLFFWVGLALLGVALWQAWRVLSGAGAGNASASTRPVRALALAAGGVNAGGLALALNAAVELLVAVMNVPVRLRGQPDAPGMFVTEFLRSFALIPDTLAAALGGLLAAGAVSAAYLFLTRRTPAPGLLLRATGAAFALVAGCFALLATYSAVEGAVAAARAAGTELPLWSQTLVIGAGFGLVGAAWLVWRAAQGVEHSARRFVVLALAAVLLAGGGWALISDAPRALASADDDMLSGFGITTLYALGTVPLQLAIGLGLATLLFQNLRGKTLFRMVFFLPYIMPFVATAMVFGLIFSHREDSIVNHALGIIGIAPQKWLLEPTGIFRLLFGAGVPVWAAGPSLALIVIMIYTVWTYAGYATVVFLAGLGNISAELYEAARIDGASGWQIFRYITFPLLSPTTFFLSLVAIIGTFQAFTQLWIMRTPGSADSIDTVSIYIFERLQDANPSYGYGSAMAFVLFAVILLLTIAQNRIAGRRVFYG